MGTELSQKQGLEQIESPHPLEKFADILHTTVHHGEVTIPQDKGYGFIRGIRPNEHMGILIVNYHLYESIPSMRPSISMPSTFQDESEQAYLLFHFQNCLSQSKENGGEPIVQISKMNFFMENDALNECNKADVYITINSEFLKQQIPEYKDSKLLEQIIENKQPLFFENCLQPKQLSIIHEMENNHSDSIFQAYDLANKGNALICQLLMSLYTRTEQTLYPIHPDDLQNIYKAREKMLSNLSIPPVLSELAQFAGMSESKFKRLFKQVFGDSVFHYYQLRRIQKAASLLDTGHYSVTEVGYRLGFTNLSHFSRQFESIIGVKPKQYRKK